MTTTGEFGVTLDNLGYGAAVFTTGLKSHVDIAL